MFVVDGLKTLTLFLLMQGFVNMKGKLVKLLFVYFFIVDLVIVKGSVGGEKRRILHRFSDNEAFRGLNEFGSDEVWIA